MNWAGAQVPNLTSSEHMSVTLWPNMNHILLSEEAAAHGPVYVTDHIVFSLK